MVPQNIPRNQAELTDVVIRLGPSEINQDKKLGR